jgi:hypothetical protein
MLPQKGIGNNPLSFSDRRPCFQEQLYFQSEICPGVPRNKEHRANMVKLYMMHYLKKIDVVI